MGWPISRLFGAHFRVTCSACRKDAELCAKRLLDEQAKRWAVNAFRRAGWHVDNFDGPRERWFCSDCAKRQHL